jgi:hypothetical protein
MNTQNHKEPTLVLQEAIDKLAVFTHSKTRLEVTEQGTLIAPETSPLERVMGLARYYISPLFSDQAKVDQEKKLSQLKQEILQARDTLKSHSFLIEKFKEGNEFQKKLAQSALETINHYNAIVSEDSSSLSSKYHFNFERSRLLLDAEIKGQAIEIPQKCSVKFDSHPTLAAQQTIKKLSVALQIKQSKGTTFSSIHKKTDQFMLDTFRMKGIRMLQAHKGLANSMGCILELVKQTPIEIQDDEAQLISMSQNLEFAPGFTILLTGSFKRNASETKFMSMPVIESLRLSSEMVHSGYPYPSQHSGWSLTEKMIDAQPLRSDQVPLLHVLLQRKKKLAHALLYDQASITRSRLHFKLTREIFDRRRDDFILLHKGLCHAMALAADLDPEGFVKILNDFFDYVAAAPSAFDVLVKTQQQINTYFIEEPATMLGEQWLSVESSDLRTGTHQEKYQKAVQIIQDVQKDRLNLFEAEHPVNHYIQWMGLLIGKASQSITLQYQSEKIGFAPPMLTDFERKLQTCAFQQVEWFINDFERPLELDETKFEKNLKEKWEADIILFKTFSLEDLDLSASHLTNSLEVYFNSRFYRDRQG